MPRKKNTEEVAQEEQGFFQTEPEASLEEAEVFPVDAESEEMPGVIPGSEECEHAAEEGLAVEPAEETTDGEDDPDDPDEPDDPDDKEKKEKQEDEEKDDEVETGDMVHFEVFILFLLAAALSGIVLFRRREQKE